MCQGGKPDTGKFHSSYIIMYVAPPMRMGACYGSGLSIIIIILLLSTSTYVCLR